jgi:endonuclease V-like protein UPF0215 family
LGDAPRAKSRPHVLGVDDAPFEKGQTGPVPVVAVMMEGADLVEAVAIGAFAVDGDDATGYLAGWIGGLRFRASLQAVLLGGITLAGLAVVDVRALAQRLSLPVLVATRRAPSDAELVAALTAAGLAARIPLVTGAPRAARLGDGLFVAQAGTTDAEAARLVSACLRKAQLPEPLRVAHLVGAALVRGESRGRV